MTVDDIKPMDAIHAIYLDWVNNYLTTARMADHYGLREDTMGDLIERGRMIHEERNSANALSLDRIDLEPLFGC